MPIANRSISDADLAGTDQQVETLVAELSRVVRTAEPEKRAGLKELAETLLHEELSTVIDAAEKVETGQSRSRFNPLAPGILLGILGLGLLLIVPPVGVTLAGIGLILVLWGAVMSGLRR
ncbi:MAG TPA: hypothetical protein VH985_00850 [Candidatus Binatia bacterium]|jgi:hypothetical protein